MADEETVIEEGADTTAAAETETQETATQEAGTVLTDTSDDTADSTAAAPPTWPEDWRQRLAGNNDKALKRLERLVSPEKVVQSLLAAEQKIRSGELRPTLPENATDEQVAAYRKSVGIPDEPAGYDVQLGEGHTIGEADQPLVDSFKEAAHAANMTPEHFNSALNWYFAQQDAMAQQTAEFDAATKKATEDALRAEWGGEYRQNLSALRNALAGAPEGLAENLMNARMGDGTKFGDNADALKYLVGLVREANPIATILPNASGDPAKSLADEIADIEKKMREPVGPDGKNEYWRDPKIRDRYRQLLEAQNRAA